MNISKDFLEKLKTHNPFRTWGNLTHDLTYKKKVHEGFVSRMGKIAWHRLEYGDSVFMPMPRKFWKKFRKRFKEKGTERDVVRAKRLYGLKYRWSTKDPVCELEGLRVWCFTHRPIFKRPRLVFRINK